MDGILILVSLIILLLLLPFICVGLGMTLNWGADNPLIAKGSAGFLCGCMLSFSIILIIFITETVDVLGDSFDTTLGYICGLYLPGCLAAVIVRWYHDTWLAATVVRAGPGLLWGFLVLLVLGIAVLVASAVGDVPLTSTYSWSPLVVWALAMAIAYLRVRKGCCQEDQQEDQHPDAVERSPCHHFVYSICCWGALILALTTSLLANFVVVAIMISSSGELGTSFVPLAAGVTAVLLLFTAALGRCGYRSQCRRLDRKLESEAAATPYFVIVHVEAV